MPLASQPPHPDRLHIDVDDPEDVHIWSKHLGVKPKALIEAIQTVGPAVPSVRKELGISEPDADI
jgi:hypothetical protein